MAPTVRLPPAPGLYRAAGTLALLGSLVGLPMLLVIDPANPARVWVPVVIALIPVLSFGPFALYCFLHASPAWAHVALDPEGFTIARPLLRDRRYSWDRVAGFDSPDLKLPFLQGGLPLFQLHDGTIHALPWIRGLHARDVARLMEQVRSDRRPRRRPGPADTAPVSGLPADPAAPPSAQAAARAVHLPLARRPCALRVAAWLAVGLAGLGLLMAGMQAGATAAGSLLAGFAGIVAGPAMAARHLMALAAPRAGIDLDPEGFTVRLPPRPRRRYTWPAVTGFFAPARPLRALPRHTVVRTHDGSTTPLPAIRGLDADALARLLDACRHDGRPRRMPDLHM